MIQPELERRLNESPTGSFSVLVSLANSADFEAFKADLSGLGLTGEDVVEHRIAVNHQLTGEKAYQVTGPAAAILALKGNPRVKELRQTRDIFAAGVVRVAYPGGCHDPFPNRSRTYNW
ncbi:hypothetical protein HYU16_04400 [Candidatus Woesearchaeota archaeon]|nr:hypothetical protein [Candidatus Woesearchaeota archaeon]